MSIKELKKHIDEYMYKKEQENLKEQLEQHQKEQQKLLGIPKDTHSTLGIERGTSYASEAYKQYKNQWDEFHPKPVPSLPNAHIIDYPTLVNDITTSTTSNRKIKQSWIDHIEQISKDLAKMSNQYGHPTPPTTNNLTSKHRNYLTKVKVHYTIGVMGGIDEDTDKVINRVLKDGYYTDSQKPLLNEIRYNYPLSNTKRTV